MIHRTTTEASTTASSRAVFPPVSDRGRGVVAGGRLHLDPLEGEQGLDAVLATVLLQEIPDPLPDGFAPVHVADPVHRPLELLIDPHGNDWHVRLYMYDNLYEVSASRVRFAQRRPPDATVIAGLAFPGTVSPLG